MSDDKYTRLLHQCPHLPPQSMHSGIENKDISTRPPCGKVCEDRSYQRSDSHEAAKRGKVAWRGSEENDKIDHRSIYVGYGPVIDDIASHAETMLSLRAPGTDIIASRGINTYRE